MATSPTGDYSELDELRGDIEQPEGGSSTLSPYELYLGVPSVSGYVLSSTTAGVRSWIAGGGGGSGDVTAAGDNNFTGNNDFLVGKFEPSDATFSDLPTLRLASGSYVLAAGDLDGSGGYIINDSGTIMFGGSDGTLYDVGQSLITSAAGGTLNLAAQALTGEWETAKWTVNNTGLALATTPQLVVSNDATTVKTRLGVTKSATDAGWTGAMWTVNSSIGLDGVGGGAKDDETKPKDFLQIENNWDPGGGLPRQDEFHVTLADNRLFQLNAQSATPNIGWGSIMCPIDIEVASNNTFAERDNATTTLVAYRSTNTFSRVAVINKNVATTAAGSTLELKGIGSAGSGISGGYSTWWALTTDLGTGGTTTAGTNSLTFNNRRAASEGASDAVQRPMTLNHDGTVTFRGTVTATAFAGSGASLTSVNASTVTLANDTADADNFITFGNAATGANALKTNAGLTFDATDGNLIASKITSSGNMSFGGELTGGDATFSNDLSVSGAITGASLVAGGAITGASLIATGNIELGHATDTTLSRASAGVVAIEGVNVLTQTGTQTGITNKTFVAPVLGAATGTSLALSGAATVDSLTTVGGGVTVPVGLGYANGTRVTMRSAAAGDVSFYRTDAASAFANMHFGSTSSISSPGWTINFTGTTFAFRATNSTVDASITAANVTASGTLSVAGIATHTGGAVLGTKTVGTLPTASSNTYLSFIVTDSLAPVLSSTVSAGGSAKAAVRSNGTNWIVTEVL